MLGPDSLEATDMKQTSVLLVIGAVVAIALVLSGALLYFDFQPRQGNSQQGSLSSRVLNEECNPSVARACAGTSLVSSNLVNANLTGANLSHFDLSFANLENATLAGADLTGANLQNANLLGANITNAKISSAYLCGTVMPSGYVNDADCTG
jgi:uncharacterized protein YjbI with pentapeptide repeats